MTKRTPALVREARALYERGLTGGQVAAQLGVSQPTVSRWLKPSGVSRPRTTPRSPTATDEILRLRQSGMSWRQIANTTGMSLGGVHGRYQIAIREKENGS